MSKPIDKIEQFPVEASFFANEGQNGTWFNAQISKVYEKDGQWHRTNSFSSNDLLKLNAIMPRVTERMHELEYGRPHEQSRSNTQNMAEIKQEAQQHLASERNVQNRSQEQDL
ncbi:MAG: hypothetical protein AAF511_12680 [Pseudomonadota bacterium]